LLLQPFTRADAADVFAYASNPNVSRFTSWETHRTVANSEAFIERVLARSPDEHTWAIRQLNDPTVIGAIEFNLIAPDIADFHYVLSEPFWNLGLMTEAARAVLAWGLEHYPMTRRVTTAAMSQNVASTRVMEKCGLKFDRTCLKKWDKFAEPVEESVYVLNLDRPVSD
jgi:ribosomal-protein-alanine N-acetyltransferase